MDRYPASLELVPTTQVQDDAAAILAAMGAVDADIDLHLLDAAPPALPGVEWGDLSEASYAGYAAKTITVASLTVDQLEPSGAVRFMSTLLRSWDGPTDDVPVTIYGIAWTEGGGITKLYRVFTLTTPIVLNTDTDVLPYIPTITFPAGQMSI